MSNHSLSHDYVYGGVISHRHKSHNYKKSSCAARDQRKVQGDQLIIVIKQKLNFEFSTVSRYNGKVFVQSVLKFRYCERGRHILELPYFRE